MHVIHANRIVQRPWGWRDAVVHEWLDNGWLRIRCLEGRTVDVWHHRDLITELPIGEPVLVHRLHSALGFGSHILNVVCDGDLGPAPRAARTSPFPATQTAGLVDLETSRGVDLRTPPSLLSQASTTPSREIFTSARL
jgi:hypothetical protein